MGEVQVCREWEARARQVSQEDVRLVLLRIGVVLGKDGGALGWLISVHSIPFRHLLIFSMFLTIMQGCTTIPFYLFAPALYCTFT